MFSCPSAMVCAPSKIIPNNKVSYFNIIEKVSVKESTRFARFYSVLNVVDNETIQTEKKTNRIHSYMDLSDAIRCNKRGSLSWNFISLKKTEKNPIILCNVFLEIHPPTPPKKDLSSHTSINLYFDQLIKPIRFLSSQVFLLYCFIYTVSKYIWWWNFPQTSQESQL